MTMQFLPSDQPVYDQKADKFYGCFDGSPTNLLAVSRANSRENMLSGEKAQVNLPVSAAHSSDAEIARQFGDRPRSNVSWAK